MVGRTQEAALAEAAAGLCYVLPPSVDRKWEGGRTEREGGGGGWEGRRIFSGSSCSRQEAQGWTGGSGLSRVGGTLQWVCGSAQRGVVLACGGRGVGGGGGGRLAAGVGGHQYGGQGGVTGQLWEET